MKNDTDTIAAVATALGRGGIGIVRLSGDKAPAIAEKIIREKLPAPRIAHYASFYNEQNEVIDFGLILYFPAPHSFTGEHVVEFQGHGGVIVLDCVLQELLKHGARLSAPGEFSERAFLNDKIDLVQAEAIADLIDSHSEQAVKSAIRSLKGEFSTVIHELTESLIECRMQVEACIDFPDEEIEFITHQAVLQRLEKLLETIARVFEKSKQGAMLRDGLTVVIAGEPNAGKSTLLNKLSQRRAAIVSDMPGTTRDIMREYIQIDGLPLHILDTAGIRESECRIEQEGIRLANEAASEADHILWMLDATTSGGVQQAFNTFLSFKNTLPHKKLSLVLNKVDVLSDEGSEFVRSFNDLLEKKFSEKFPIIAISAKHKIQHDESGIGALKSHLKKIAGFENLPEGCFLSRRRHLTALEKAKTFIMQAKEMLRVRAGLELVAEDLRLAQLALSEITGEFTSDDLLGKIFSTFCIGK